MVISPTYFTSKTQKKFSLPSMEAGYNSLGIITHEVMFEAQILDKLFRKEYEKPSLIYEKNLGAIYVTKNFLISQRSKYIDVQHHCIRDLIKTNKIEIQYVRSKENISQILTKSVNLETF